jgi:hypothetical protein
VRTGLLVGFGCLSISPLPFGNFFPVYSNVAGRFDADADLSAVHRHNGNLDVIADSQGFAGSSGEYQHRFRFAMKCRRTVTSRKGKRCEYLLPLIVGLRRTFQGETPCESLPARLRVLDIAVRVDEYRFGHMSLGDFPRTDGGLVDCQLLQQPQQRLGLTHGEALSVIHSKVGHAHP